jgi:hypothetical protein
LILISASENRIILRGGEEQFVVAGDSCPNRVSVSWINFRRIVRDFERKRRIAGVLLSGPGDCLCGSIRFGNIFQSRLKNGIWRQCHALAVSGGSRHRC